MQANKRILFIENEPLKISSITRPLGHKYEIKIITDVDEGRAELRNRWWPLVVADIRLIDERSENDISGLELVCEADPDITKLILTAYPTAEAAIRALTLIYPKELPPAVDFVSKLDPPEKIIDKIIQAIEVRSRINWNLQVEFDSPLTFLGMADWFHKHKPDSRPTKQSVTESAEELAHLWQRLFNHQKRLTVYPLPIGRGDTLVHKVKPCSVGNELLQVVKCGWKSKIKEEIENYEKYVRHYAGAISTQLLTTAQTLNFSAISYSLVGGRLENTIRFSDFYRAATIGEIRKAIFFLFENACKNWYEMPVVRRSDGLDREYRQKLNFDLPERRKYLIEQIEELGHEASSLGFEAVGKGKKLEFKFENGLSLSLVKLLQWIYETERVAPKHLDLASFSTSPTHGDLNSGNILVDAENHTWLIDFGCTGYGYRLRDFAELESNIALDLVVRPGTTLVPQFEDLLIKPQRWDYIPEAEEGYSLDNTEFQKAYQAIKEIRRLARLHQQDESSMACYHLALLFEAVRRLITDGRESLPSPAPIWLRAHALQRAAYLIRSLSS